MLSSQGGDCSPTIHNNYIHHNSWQGISAWDVTGGSNINPNIYGNEIAYNLTGIYLYYASGDVRDNYIHDNFVPGNANSGAGIMVEGASSAPIIRRNEITGNFTGFYIVGGANPNLGDMINDYPSDDGENYIHDNIDESGNTWSVYNGSGNEILAQNNIWDSELPSEIDATIMGSVNYEPINPMEFNAPTDVFTEDLGPNTIFIDWEVPVPSGSLPILNYNIYLDGVLVDMPIETEYVLDGMVDGVQYEIGLSTSYLYGFESWMNTNIEWPNDSNDYDVTVVNMFRLTNHPNPFNPSTTISFNLTTEHTENTQILIYNTKGQRVDSIPIYPSTHSHGNSVIWNAERLASGVYFYKLNVNGKIIGSKKCLLIK